MGPFSGAEISLSSFAMQQKGEKCHPSIHAQISKPFRAKCNDADKSALNG